MTISCGLGGPVLLFPVMKDVANVMTIQEAQNIKMQLGSCGIEAFIPDEVSAVVAPHHFMTPTGVRVQVADEDEEAALEVLKEFEAQQEEQE